MAKVRNNIITQGLSGSLGDQIVFRSDKAGRTIVAAKPAFSSDREFNAAQLTQQEAFRRAITYAKSAKDEVIYISKAQGTALSAFNVAVADWFNKPEILEIDASGWTGEIGQKIRVKAQDEIHVAKVHVVVGDADGVVFEQGEAVRAEGLWWTYTTTALRSTTAAPRIVATAHDLPGNNAEMALEN